MAIVAYGYGKGGAGGTGGTAVDLGDIVLDEDTRDVTLIDLDVGVALPAELSVALDDGGVDVTLLDSSVDVGLDDGNLDVDLD
jgi:hypothetical protein